VTEPSSKPTEERLNEQIATTTVVADGLSLLTLFREVAAFSHQIGVGEVIGF